MKTAAALGFAAACLVAICHAPAARAQTIYVGLDAARPVAAPSPDHPSVLETRGSDVPFWLNWHSRSYVEEDIGQRFGVRVGRSEITALVTTVPPTDRFYRNWTFEVTYDRLLYRKGSWLATAGFGLGWAYFSDHSDAYPGYGEWGPLPDAEGLLTPEIRLIFGPSIPYGAFASVRQTIYLTATDTAYPFETGTVFSTGFLVH